MQDTSFYSVELARKKILFVVNYDKPNAQDMCKRLSDIAESEGFLCVVESAYPVNPEAFKGVNLCCVIGGDGTILACLEGAIKYNVPIFGVNLGKLGFMATFTDSIKKDEFVKMLKGDTLESVRTLIQAQTTNSTDLALNEIAIKSSNASEIMTVSVFANGEYVADFVGDGLIFSTPTGTSAYNLSAGGPLIYPQARAFVLTCICPHTLTHRSIVFDDSMTLTAKVRNPNAILIADGKVIKNWDSSEKISISVPNQTVKFLQPKNHSHFYILRTKLGWGENPRNSRNKTS